MAVIIDEVNAEVESAPPAEERQETRSEAPPQAQTDELRRYLRRMEQRRARLKAD